MNLTKVRNDLSLGIPITSIKLRVTDYSRVSTDDIKQKKSLQNQVEHFDEYIKSNPNWTYVKGYVDEGITGTSDIKRQQFMKMIEDAAAGKFDLIITKEISRFSRNTLDSIKYTRMLLDYGVAVLFVNDNINTALPDSELRLTIMASMAQDEIRRLSERVKFGMKRATLKGEILGNDLLYGYKKNKQTTNLEILPNESEIVKRIYRFYAIDKFSLNKIAKMLNEEKVSTKLGNKWSATGLSRIISNPKYKGYYCANKTKTDNYITKKVKHLEEKEWVIYKDYQKIPPIVDEMVWERANQRLISRRKTNKPNNIEERNLYTSKLICANDNESFHRRQFRKTKNDYTWICANYLKNSKAKCDSANIRESELNQILTNIIKPLIDKKVVKKTLLDFYKKEIARNHHQEEILNLNHQKDKIINKKEKLLELSLDNLISNLEFKKKNHKLSHDLDNIESQLNKVNKQKIDENNDDIEKAITQRLNSQKLDKHLIQLLLDKIIVSKTDNYNLELKVYFKKDYNLDLKKTTYKYAFKRGYDTKSTPRYILNYKIVCFI